MIQNRITICGSAQRFFSKCWWIGAISPLADVLVLDGSSFRTCPDR
jgi:hypothetical protein